MSGHGAVPERTRTFARDDDADLLGYMAMAEQDPTGARAAWAEFYERHVRFLYAVCLKAYGAMLGSDADVADLVADTMRRVYEHAGAFRKDGIGDPARLRRRVRAWLCRVAQRLAMDILRGRARLPTVRLEPDAWQQVPDPGPSAEEEQPGERVRLVREALAQLSDREQTVLRVTFQWYRAGQEHQRLPNDVTAELAATLQTTPENLRQIRRRALKKVEAFLRDRESCPPNTRNDEKREDVKGMPHDRKTRS